MSTTPSPLIYEFNPVWEHLAQMAEAQRESSPPDAIAHVSALAHSLAKQIALAWTLDLPSSDRLEDLVPRFEVGGQDSAVARDLKTIASTLNGAPSKAAAEAALTASQSLLRWYHFNCGMGGCRGLIAAAPGPECGVKDEVDDSEGAPPSCATVIGADGDPEARLESLAAKAFEAIRSVGRNSDELSRAIEAARLRISAARQPFKLGVVGEFRSGKSTLINALAGEALAYTDAVEATPFTCVFRYGPERAATVIYRDGTTEDYAPDSLNEQIQSRKDDDQWVASVSRVEYYAPNPSLTTLEPWDAPGLGGSARNEALANEFITEIGGAIWVFDATGIGNAALITPLLQLKNAGKKVVAALNRVDLLGDPEAIEETAEYLTQIYPGVFSSVVALSAKLALENVLSGAVDEPLEQLRAASIHDLIDTAEIDRDRRINLAVANGDQSIARIVREQYRWLSDRVGLVRHTEKNLCAARDRMLADLPGFVERQMPYVYRDASTRAAQILAEDADGIAGGARTWWRELGPSSPVDSFLDEHTPIKAAYRQVSEGVLAQVETTWNSQCLDALQLSRAAIPDVDIGGFEAFPADGHRENARHHTWLGYLTGVVDRFAEWLNSLVIGKDEWAFRKRFTVEAVERAALSRRDYIRSHASGQLQEHLRLVLQSETSTMLSRLHVELFGSRRSGQQIDRAMRTLKEIDHQLRSDAAALYSSEDLGTGQQGDGDRPLVVDASPISNRRWRSFLRSIDRRLDVLVPQVPHSLGGLLNELDASIQVRLLTSSNESELKAVASRITEAFGAWAGKWKAGVAVRDDGNALPLSELLLITPDEALKSDQALSDIGLGRVVFNEYPEGCMAAQREFAELWACRSTHFGPVRLHFV
jgi:GTPase SAR1 family protein